MLEYFKQHQDLVLASAALLMLIGLVSFFIWGVGIVADNLNQAVASPPTPNDISPVNIETAKKILDARGLLGQPPPSLPPCSTAASSTATSTGR